MKSIKLFTNKKGFSLIELIIVMAIIVALTALLAPQFVKYVQRARDNVVSDSAEEVLHITKSEYALGNLKLADDCDEGVITVKTNSDGYVVIEMDDTLEYTSDTDSIHTFQELCAQDMNKKAKSNVVWEIRIIRDCYGAIFSREKVQDGEQED